MKGDIQLDNDLIIKLLKAFPKSYINKCNECIVHEKANIYLILANIENEEQLKCKVIEWFSRPSFKSFPYSSNKANDKFHKFMLEGINELLGTSFTKEDMETIYTELGNSCNHDKTIEFVRSGYDFKVLE